MAAAVEALNNVGGHPGGAATAADALGAQLLKLR
jgi:hypothetical protein